MFPIFSLLYFFRGIAQNTTTKEPNGIAFGGGGVGVAVMHRPDPIAEQQRRRLYRIALNFFNKFESVIFNKN